MRKFFVVLCVLFAGFHLGAQTTLSAGDVIFIGYNSYQNPTAAYPNFISLLARVPIQSGTKIYLTNQDWDATTQKFDALTTSPWGTIQITFDEDISIGQIIEVKFSTTDSSLLKSTVGVPKHMNGKFFDFNHQNQDDLYIYQNATSPTVLSGMAWKDAPTPASEIPTGINFSGVNQNAFEAKINGSSEKCGLWTPLTPSTQINFSSSIGSNFYDSNNWVFYNGGGTNLTVAKSTNGGGSGLYCPCNPDSAGVTGLTNLYAAVEANIEFDRYLYNKNGHWRVFNSATSKWDATTVPDWGTVTKKYEVILNKSYTLPQPLATDTLTFECATLTIQDTASGPDGVQLIVPPGAALKIHYGLHFLDGHGTIRPSIYFQTDFQSGKHVYSVLAPTSAMLNDPDGDFIYDLRVQRPGWHHFQSPISTAFTSITPSNLNFAFRDAAGSVNFYSWSATTSQWVAGNTNSDFSTTPYTIYFDANEVPTVLTVKGTLSVTNQDAIQNLTSSYHNPTSNGNVPGWSGDKDDGWNFYGNPYLSALSVDVLMSTFNQSASNSYNMQGLQNKVYVWQPGVTIANDTSNYELRTFLPGSGSGSFGGSAQYLPPFQAFFMRSPNASSSKGFVHSKKYRKSFRNLTDANSILNKTDPNKQGSQRILRLTDSLGNVSKLYAVPVDSKKAVFDESDVLANISGQESFGIAFQGSLFKLKFWPILESDTSSVQVIVSADTEGRPYVLTSSDPNTFLLDRALNVLHSFQQGDYTFTHQTAYNASPRFTWIFAGNATVGLEEELWQPEPVVVSYGEGWVKFSYSEDVDFALVDMQGKTLHSGRILNGEYTLETGSLPSGLYTILSNAFSSKFIVR